MSRSLFPAKVSIPAFVLACALALLLSGCGGGKADIEPAKGKVVCGSGPVTAGTVTFVPLGEPGKDTDGRPAIGAVGPDGTFVLTTYEDGDGAIVGKHRVEYAGPGDEAAEETEDEAPPEGSAQERALNAQRLRERQAKQKSQCVLNGELILEVTAGGENDFTIQLSPPGIGQGSGRGDQEFNREEQ
ncbi:MAG: hypothetical protein GX575_22755 [Candidatus Anammoximicrobium sp.]|nr:hypothetical protein [Candidatus Anammoximicrobium sp.]